VPLTPVSVSVEAPAERVRRRWDRSLMEQLARVSKSSAQWVRLNCCRCKAYPKFHNEIGVPIVRVGCSEFERRKITHTSTSIWAMPVTSSAPIALRYSISILVWAHMKLIRQIVPTVTWTELKKQQRHFPRRFNGHSPCARL
jgi:hypothetical protein